MQPKIAATTTDILYIGADQPSVDELRTQLGVVDTGIRIRVAPVSEAVESAIPTPSPDCLILGELAEETALLDTYSRIRDRYPDRPIVVFAPESQTAVINRIIGNGPADVVHQSIWSTSPLLIQQRIDAIAGTSIAAGSGSEQHYEMVLESVGDAVFQLDSACSIRSVNDAATELVGYDRSALLDTHVSEILVADFAERYEPVIAELRTESATSYRSLEGNVSTASGAAIPCEFRITVTHGEELSISIVAVSEEQEETDLKQVRKRSELLRHLGDNLHDVVWINSPDGEIEFVSQAYEDIWGRPRSELYRDPNAFRRQIHPDDVEAVAQAQAEKWEDPDSYEQVYRIVRPDGDMRWIHDSGFGVYESGELQRLVGIARDISGLREREEALEQKQRFLQHTQEVANIGCWEVDYRTDTLEWTEEVYEITNHPTGETPSIAETVDMVHEEDRSTFRSAFDRLTADAEPFDIELRLGEGTDDSRWTRISGEPTVQDGEVVGARGVTHDIHQRKQREHDLQAERDLVERILETSPVGIIVHDVPDGRIHRVNETAAELLGMDHSTLIDGAPIPEGLVIRSPDGEQLTENELPLEQIRETEEPIRGEEVVIEKPSGERSILSVDGVPLFEDGELRRIVITFDDVTDRVQRERRLTAQRNQLAQLDRINRIIRTVDEALIDATSRTEIEQAVCDRLSESGRYYFTLAVRVPNESRLELSASCDTGQQLVADQFPLTDLTVDTSPGVRAFETGEVQTIERITESERDDVGGESDFVLPEHLRSLAAIPIQFEGQQYGVIAVSSTDPNMFDDRELEVLEELGHIVGHAIDAVESRAREAAVTALYEATQDLLAAEDQSAVCEVAVETAADVLDMPGAGIFMLDDQENELWLAAGTDELIDFVGESRRFGPNGPDSAVWDTYISAEETVYPDIRAASSVNTRDTPLRGTVLVPIGDRGVFVASSTQAGTIPEDKRKLVGLLAATTEAVLDRLAGQAGIRERDAELAERSASLALYEQLFSFIRQFDDLVRGAGTRDEIEAGVCEMLLSVDSFTFAWIGSLSRDGDELEPRAWAGAEDGYLDDVALSLDGDLPAARVARTDEAYTAERIAEQLRGESWARAAVDRNFGSVIAVPITYGETSYGVLSLYAETHVAFDEIAIPVLKQLGHSMAHHINTVEVERGILAEEPVELELALEHPATFLNVVADVAGEPVSYREIEPGGDGKTHVLFALEDPPVDAVLALEDEYVVVDSLTQANGGENHVFSATLSARTVAASVLECGGIPQDVVASGDSTRAVVRLPRDIDVRVFMDRIKDRYPGVTLVSRQDVEPDQTADPALEATLEDDLTERQREVLVTAFEAGFFESPRATTGEELAAMLDVSPPTVTHHLREAQRRVFSAMLDSDS